MHSGHMHISRVNNSDWDGLLLTLDNSYYMHVVRFVIATTWFNDCMHCEIQSGHHDTEFSLDSQSRMWLNLITTFLKYN